MASSKILLILGAGANVGAATAKHFASKGYKVAVTNRTDPASGSPYFHIKADLSQPDKVKDVFSTVKSQFGSPPNVVIYNAAHVHPTGEDPLSLPQDQFELDLAVNITSPYLAAQEAIKGFAELPAEVPKSFIYTGNGLNTEVWPMFVTLGLGKTATAHVIESAVKAYEGKGWTFYYGDERQPDGGLSVKGVNGEAHAERYWDLSQDREQQPWMHTFVAGEGYKNFA